MAFEREAIAPMTPAPAIQQMEMREERVLTPYASRPTLVKPLANDQNKVQDKLSSLNGASSEQGAPAEETVTLSPAAAAIARKEQKVRQQQLELKAKEAALEAERKEIAELKELKAKIAAKDYSALEGMVDYNEFTNHLIEKSNQLTPEQQKIKALEERLESVDKNYKDDVSKRFEAAVNDRRKAVKDLVSTNPEYAIIKNAGYEEHVVQYILDTWEHDSIDLEPETAAKEVKAILRERKEKLDSYFKEDTAEPEKKELPPLKASVKTITNNMTVNGEVKPPRKSFQGMSDSERYAEARRRAEEKLQKGIR